MSTQPIGLEQTFVCCIVQPWFSRNGFSYSSEPLCLTFLKFFLHFWGFILCSNILSSWFLWGSLFLLFSFLFWLRWQWTLRISFMWGLYRSPGSIQWPESLHLKLQAQWYFTILNMITKKSAFISGPWPCVLSPPGPTVVKPSLSCRLQIKGEMAGASCSSRWSLSKNWWLARYA